MISIKGSGRVSLRMARDIADSELNEIVIAWRSENQGILILLINILKQYVESDDTDALWWWVSTLHMFAAEVEKYSTQIKTCKNAA
jgi:hypothetical protein